MTGAAVGLSQTSVAVESMPTNMLVSLGNPASGVAYTYSWSAVNIVSQSSDSGSGVLSSSSPFSFPAQAPGLYEVSVTVTGSDGSSTSVSQLVSVAPVAPAPVISGVPTSPVVGTTYTLTGAAPAPGPADGVLAYQWLVTGPNGFSAVGAGTSMTVTPPFVGPYTVTLTATDAAGVSGATTVEFGADPAPLMPVIQGMASGTSVASGNITAMLAAAVPTGDPAVTYIYAWSVSDQNTQAVVATGTDPTFTFTGPATDSYVVSLTVSEFVFGGFFQSATAIAPLFVAQPNTTLTLTPANVPTGATQVFVVALGNDVIDGSALSIPQVQLAQGGHDTLMGGMSRQRPARRYRLQLALGGSGPNTLYATANDTLVGGGRDQLEPLPDPARRRRGRDGGRHRQHAQLRRGDHGRQRQPGPESRIATPSTPTAIP